MRAHARETGGDKPHKTHIRCTQCVLRSSIQASQHNIYTVGVQELHTGLALKLWNSRKPANQQSRIFSKSSGTPFHSLLECPCIGKQRNAALAATLLNGTTAAHARERPRTSSHGCSSQDPAQDLQGWREEAQHSLKWAPQKAAGLRGQPATACPYRAHQILHRARGALEHPSKLTQYRPFRLEAPATPKL